MCSMDSQYDDSMPRRNQKRSRTASVTNETDTNADDTSTSKRICLPVDSQNWSESIHRSFVSSIYDIGVKHSSPSVIMEAMQIKSEAITSERVKSHLQKYRAAKEKSKKVFMNSYTECLAQMSSLGSIPLSTSNKMLCGKMAASLTFATMQEENQVENKESTSSPPVSKKDLEGLLNGANIVFPRLTEQEKCSPLGESMCYVMGLMFSFSRHIVQSRSGRLSPPNPHADQEVPVEYSHSGAQRAQGDAQRAQSDLCPDSFPAIAYRTNPFEEESSTMGVPTNLHSNSILRQETFHDSSTSVDVHHYNHGVYDHQTNMIQPAEPQLHANYEESVDTDPSASLPPSDPNP